MGIPAADLQDRVLRKVKTLRFFQESDRELVLDIIKNFFSMREMVDAIRRHANDELQNLLAKLDEKALSAILASPIDDNCNTMLHLAVDFKNAQAVIDLLTHGASPALRNLRGDRPHQAWMFPRWSRAAS